MVIDAHVVRYPRVDMVARSLIVLGRGGAIDPSEKGHTA